MTGSSVGSCQPLTAILPALASAPSIIFSLPYFSSHFKNVSFSFTAMLPPVIIEAPELKAISTSLSDFNPPPKSIIKEVTDARKALVGAKDLGSKVKAGDQLQAALKSIFAIAEGYPQLKANENFLHLQQELSAIEDKVAYARQYYNDSVLDYANLFKTFPGNMFAKMFNKKQKEYLKIPEAARAVPKVEF